MRNFICSFKKQALFLLLLCSGIGLMAEQVVVTVNSRVDQAGNLERTLKDAGYDTDLELAAITDLKVLTSGVYTSGGKDYGIALEISDFTFLTTKLTSLASLDLSEAVVTGNYGEGRAPSNSFPGDAFKNNKTIKTFTFPSTLIGIGAGAFVNTALVGEIEIPVGVNGAANLDYTRFGNSQGITGFVADPASVYVTTINGVLFNKAMTELHYYPSGKTDISYTIPEDVTTIRNSAIEHNHHLKNLTLAATTTIMQAGTDRFDVIADHSEIENIFVQPGNTVLGSTNGILYQIATNRTVWSPRGKKELRISAPIQRIAGGGSQNSMFGGNASNTSTGVSVPNNYTKVIKLIDFPATLEVVENGAFVAADSLAVIISRATTVPTNYQVSFRSIGASLTPAWSTKVYVPASALNVYKASTWVANAAGPNPANPSETVTFSGFAAASFFAFYNLNLTSATAVSSIATDIAPEGDVVTITADQAPEGKIFDKWTSNTVGVVFDDETSKTTTFTMLASDVEIEALYKEDSGTNIEESEGYQLSIYPNPATESISLKNASNVRYTIYDALGKVVANGLASGEEISVGHFSNGVYLLNVDGKVIRFIKK